MPTDKILLVPKAFKLGTYPVIVKLEDGIRYNLTRREDRKWYFSTRLRSTRPMSKSTQVCLNMLAEHYEQELQALRQKLLALELAQSLLSD